MDSDARLRRTLAGVECAACGAGIEPDASRLLAQREDLCFVELDCAGCGSTCIGIVTFPPDGADGPGALDLQQAGVGERAGSSEFTDADRRRLAGAAPVGLPDVLAMRQLLATHRGDLRSLVEPDPGQRTSPPG